jgi:hypothetical protein
MNKKIKGIIIIASGFVVAFCFIMAGGLMGEINSIAGDSIAEAFYHAMGTFSVALGFLVVWLSVVFYFLITKE